MNWTEGALYRHKRGRLRKVNPDRQRQKEYFARARARNAEQKAAVENGPPPISYLQNSSPLSRRSQTSNRSASSAGRHASRPPSRRTAEPDRKWCKVTASTPHDTPLPTISRFLQEYSGAVESAASPIQYDEEALERMRQKLLAKKD
ncbi:uncharacterized protein B0T15DRAFT_94772 [Chaetomium strumarium]|uniref:Uncharacterized protein n=1 Tax=Chaetomium strumarium TaxID=1170767 RepID=A0AAJ0GYE9_9PEZI|nr:hypothetical protein B0T15DRAFT_94772 [Chaetomium strumarium]